MLSRQLRGRPEDHWVRAYAAYKPDLFSAKERKALERDRWCLLDRPGYWNWNLSRGPNAAFLAQFETLAARAGGSLDRTPPAGTRLIDFWLDHLLFHLRRKGTDQLFGPNEAGACIPNACQASAIYCLFLEQQALESESRARHRTAGSAGKRSKRRLGVRSGRPRPPQWSAEHRKELRDIKWLGTQPSLSQKEAAYSLDYSDRYVRKLVQDHKLNQSEKRRIQINDVFWSLFRRIHGGSK